VATTNRTEITLEVEHPKMQGKLSVTIKAPADVIPALIALATKVAEAVRKG
jgi:hypothetical protein